MTYSNTLKESLENALREIKREKRTARFHIKTELLSKGELEISDIEEIEESLEEAKEIIKACETATAGIENLQKKVGIK